MSKKTDRFDPMDFLDQELPPPRTWLSEDDLRMIGAIPTVTLNTSAPDRVQVVHLPAQDGVEGVLAPEIAALGQRTQVMSRRRRRPFSSTNALVSWVAKNVALHTRLPHAAQASVVGMGLVMALQDEEVASRLLGDGGSDGASASQTSGKNSPAIVGVKPVPSIKST